MIIWVIVTNSMLLLILIVIVTATLIAQRLVMPPPVYVACSLLGFLGWFVFMLIGGELTIPSGVILGDVLVKWIMVTILTLPLLAAVVGWRGTRSAWRWFFLGLGVILEILMSMIRVVS